MRVRERPLMEYNLVMYHGDGQSQCKQGKGKGGERRLSLNSFSSPINENVPLARKYIKKKKGNGKWEMGNGKWEME